MKKDEEAVQNANECLQKQNSALWDTDLTTLRSLQSGLLASVKFQEDFPTVKKAGGGKLKIFFLERILLNEKKMFDSISMSKLY